MEIKKYSKRTEFTRMCIADAVIALLDEQPLEQIRISNVVAKAGVSRMTFYNNYKTIEDVIKNYMQIIIEQYVRETKSVKGGKHDYERVLDALKFFEKNNKYFVVMRKRGLQGMIVDAMNEYLVSSDIDVERRYKMYFYSGGLLNVFLEWEASEKRISKEEIAKLISTSLSNL